MAYPLKPLRGEIGKQKPYVVVDIEAKNWIEFLVVGIYDGQNVKMFRSLKKCLDYLLKNYDGHDVFAHFGGKYDFLFFIGDYLKQLPRYHIDHFIPRGSGILCFDLTDGLHSITFRDSSAFLPMSLKKLTESFGVEHKKKEFDFDKMEKVTSELLEYLEYDLKGLYECIEKFRQWPIIQRAGSANTLASQALRIFRTTIEKPIGALSSNLDFKIRSAYFGGRTEIFKPVYQGSRPLYRYDVNSLYPSVMIKNEFPNHFSHLSFEYDKKQIGFWEAEVSVPTMHIPPLGINHGGKYLFPTGNFKGIWTIAELEYAKTLGVKIKPKKGYIFTNGGFLFKNYVQELYELRQNSDSQVDKTICKLLLNSLYGRFGLRREKEIVVFDHGQDGFLPMSDGTDGFLKNWAGKNYRIGTERIFTESFSNVSIAAYVTSYSRIHMHRLYMEAPEALYYTDTDSMDTTHRYPTGTGLGELKDETDYQAKNHSSCFLLPKTYFRAGKIVMKGFDHKKVQHFTFDDFQSALEGELRLLKYSEAPKFAKFKTAKRIGKFPSMTKESSRQIRTAYDKRKIIKRGGTYETEAIRLI